MPSAEVDGAPATPEQLLAAMSSYGHFTAMQVRDGRVRGLDLHLRRLDEATQTLFGRVLDTSMVRAHLRHAVAGRGAVSARVLVHADALGGDFVEFDEPRITVTTADPHEPAVRPQRMRSARYERELPEIKHLGGFGLTHQVRLANLAGYDDAVFVDHRGRISEATIWNVGFYRDGTIFWPDAALLSGITLQLLGRGLHALDIPAKTVEIPLDSAAEFESAFLINSENPGLPIASIDEATYTVDPELCDLLVRAYETNPWDEI